MDTASKSSRSRSAARHNQESRRYSSNLEHSSRHAGRRPPSRAQTPTPASSEVISSLINSLSAISAPAEDFYDRLVPNGTVTKSAPPTLSKAFLSHNVRDDIISEDPQPEILLRPDDAAISPIVRTSKPPSGYSPITAPKKQKTQLQAPVLFSTTGTHDKDRERTIGSITVEARHMPSVTSLQTVSTLQSRSNKSLKLKASREKMREFDKERKRGKSKEPQADKSENRSIHSREGVATPRNTLNAKDLSRISTAPDVPSRVASWHAASPKDFIDPSSSGPNSPSMRTVPARDSSLRHSFTPTTKKKSKSTRQKGERTEGSSNTSTTADDSISTTTKGKEKERMDDDNEESVSRRIEELKRQKEQRRISQQTLAEQARAEEAERIGRALKSSTPASRNFSLPRSATVATAPGKENMKPKVETEPTKAKREPLMRSATEPLPVDHLKTFEKIAPGRVSTSSARVLPSLADSIDEAIDDYLANPRLSQKVKDAKTGRVITFSEVGDPHGSVVFCCVGMGTTRYLMAFYDELATTLKLRLITPDRPGIGESEPHEDGSDTPLGWPDDILTICSALSLTRFSILAHSAGAVYALATALRLPTHIRGRIHLMAPWIPPSQMVAVGIQKDSVPNTSLPYGQRLLRSLPTPFLKVANSGFFALTSNSLASAMPKGSPRTSKKKRRSLSDLENAQKSRSEKEPGNERKGKRNSLPMSPTEGIAGNSQTRRNSSSAAHSPPTSSSGAANPHNPNNPNNISPERASDYDFRLTHAIWEAATTNANPAVDLLVCLERRQEIGFRYADVAKEVVIHHGAKDTRVPVENVEWLSRRMRRCELRVLEDEGHGLMASARVMGDVLGEVGREWEDWNLVTRRG